MTKKVLLGVAAVLLLGSAIGFFWVRSIFAQDTVRTAIAAQISSAIGQPVSIAGISAAIYPRVTVKLDGVTIGQPVRIRAETLRLGTNLRALFSRQIVHGDVHLDGARIELPLPPLTTGSGTGTSSGAPIEIVSIDEVVLNDVQIVSNRRTLKGAIELMPHNAGVTVKKISLSADDTDLEGSGEITNLTGPVGELTIKAGTLNLNNLLAFLSDFSSGSGISPPSSQPAPPTAAVKPSPVDLSLALSVDRALMGALALEKLNGRAHVTAAGVTIDPVEFGVFDGRYKGTMSLSGEEPPAFHINAALANVDVAKLTAFVGSPGTISGRLSGRIEAAARSADPSHLLSGARGTARVEIKDGVVRNLGLVRTIVVSTSMRADAKPGSGGSSDEKFTELGATLAIGDGAAQTSDLQFQSPDLLMRASGSLRLDGSALDLKGNVQLSDALSQQAGRDLVRYTQEQGRVTLPVTVTGTPASPSVRVDVASLAGRAIQNKAKEEINKALGNKLGGIFR